jgi:hypothetical protein
MSNDMFDRYLFRNAPKPTQTLLSLYIATAVVSIAIALLKGRKLKIGVLLVGFLLLLPIMYNTSCLILGGCNLWAWLSIFSIVIVMLLNIVNIIQYEEPQEEAYECTDCF